MEVFLRDQSSGFLNWVPYLSSLFGFLVSVSYSDSLFGLLIWLAYSSFFMGYSFVNLIQGTYLVLYLFLVVLETERVFIFVGLYII